MREQRKQQLEIQVVLNQARRQIGMVLQQRPEAWVAQLCKLRDVDKTLVDIVGFAFGGKGVGAVKKTLRQIVVVDAQFIGRCWGRQCLAEAQAAIADGFWVDELVG